MCVHLATTMNIHVPQDFWGIKQHESRRCTRPFLYSEGAAPPDYKRYEYVNGRQRKPCLLLYNVLEPGKEAMCKFRTKCYAL